MTSSKRVRTSTPRSRTGCALCRQRKVKCGEEKPSCRRCEIARWRCPGYDRPGKGPTFQEPHARDDEEVSTTRLQPQLHRSQPDILQYALAFRVPGSKDEREALHYFSTLAVADLTGLHSRGFWSKTVLQRCQHEAPIRHATAALGQIHVEFIATSKHCAFKPSCRTMQVYGKAIRSLRNYLSTSPQPNRSMVLICCVVLSCFELVRREQRAAIGHLDSGLEVLKQWRMGHDDLHDGSADARDELTAVFSRLDL